MKKLFLYILLGFLMTSNANAFGDVTYICKWDGDDENELYQIKDKKVFYEGKLYSGKITKLSYFINKIEWTAVDDGMKFNGHSTGKITVVHKVNFSTNIAIEIHTAENGWWSHGWKDKGTLVIDKNPSTYIGECHKM